MARPALAGRAACMHETPSQTLLPARRRRVEVEGIKKRVLASPAQTPAWQCQHGSAGCDLRRYLTGYCRRAACICRSRVPKEGASVSSRPCGLSVCTQCPAAGSKCTRWPSDVMRASSAPPHLRRCIGVSSISTRSRASALPCLWKLQSANPVTGQHSRSHAHYTPPS